jgi:AcrR family transcriptional regulator
MDGETLPAPARAPSSRVLDVREAALTLFAERGYHGTTVRDIGAELGIRAPSLYNHIRSKQGLLREIMVETSTAVWEEFEAAVRDVEDPEERLRRAMHAYVKRHTTHPREALIVNRELSSLGEPARSEVRALRRRHERAIRGIITDGVEAGRFDLDTPSLGSFAVLEMAVSVARWFRPDGPLSAEDVSAHYAEFAVRLVRDGGA